MFLSLVVEVLNYSEFNNLHILHYYIILTVYFTSPFFLAFCHLFYLASTPVWHTKSKKEENKKNLNPRQVSTVGAVIYAICYGLMGA